MSEIDLTIPTSQYSVPTTVVRNGIGYMGPNVKINANNSQDAINRIEQAGYKYNNHFQPENITPDRAWYER